MEESQTWLSDSDKYDQMNEWCSELNTMSRTPSTARRWIQEDVHHSSVIHDGIIEQHTVTAKTQ